MKLILQCSSQRIPLKISWKKASQTLAARNHLGGSTLSSRLNVAILSPVIEKSYRTLIWLNHCENIGAGNMYSFLVRNSNPFMFYIANGYMLVIHILKNVSYISYCTINSLYYYMYMIHLYCWLMWRKCYPSFIKCVIQYLWLIQSWDVEH